MEGIFNEGFRNVLNIQLPLLLSVTSHQFFFFMGSQNRLNIKQFPLSLVKQFPLREWRHRAVTLGTPVWAMPMCAEMREWRQRAVSLGTPVWAL